MGNELDKADIADNIYLSGNRSVYVGDRYSKTMVKCGSACSSVYAFNFDYAVFQEIMVEKESKTHAGVVVNKA